MAHGTTRVFTSLGLRISAHFWDVPQMVCYIASAILEIETLIGVTCAYNTCIFDARCQPLVSRSDIGTGTRPQTKHNVVEEYQGEGAFL
jgi:hypothetical protein